MACDPSDLIQSAGGAARMLRDRLNADHGDLATALADYNWGSGNVKKYGLQAAPQETRGEIAKVFGGMGLAPPVNSLYASAAKSVNTGSPTGQVVTANQPGSMSSDGGGGKVDVVVEFVNAPPGMRPQLKTSGNVTARIGTSAVGVAPV